MFIDEKLGIRVTDLPFLAKCVRVMVELGDAVSSKQVSSVKVTLEPNRTLKRKWTTVRLDGDVHGEHVELDNVANWEHDFIGVPLVIVVDNLVCLFF